jgi:hypothetical protein
MAKERLALDELVAAIHESDPVRRVQALARAWSSNGTLEIDDALVARGITETHTLIIAWSATPSRWVQLLWRRRRAGHEWGLWKVGGPGLKTTVFEVLAHLDDRQRIAELVVRQQPPASENRSRAQRLIGLASDNPVAAAGLAGGALYLALRLPVGLFYSTLGVSADDVGVGPQVLVPQSLLLVVSFLAAVLAVAALMYMSTPVFFTRLGADLLRADGDHRPWRAINVITIAAVPLVLGLDIGGLALLHSVEDFLPFTHFVAVVLLAFLLTVLAMDGASILLRRRSRELDEAAAAGEWRYRRLRGARMLAAAVAIALIFYGALLLGALPFWAKLDAGRVRSGGTAGGVLTPWRALPVTIHWMKPDHVALVNNCVTLRLLGVGNAQIVLYDTKLDKLFRIPVADAEASVDRSCV